MMIESDFYTTPAGREHFQNQLQSIRYCVQETVSVANASNPAFALLGFYGDSVIRVPLAYACSLCFLCLQCNYDVSVQEHRACGIHSMQKPPYSPESILVCYRCSLRTSRRTTMTSRTLLTNEQRARLKHTLLFLLTFHLPLVIADTTSLMPFAHVATSARQCSMVRCRRLQSIRVLIVC